MENRRNSKEEDKNRFINVRKSSFTNWNYYNKYNYIYHDSFNV